ncbi:MAG: ABC transporter permease [Minwuia sp.]|nr:ABC transporter permease [Minwuia sp.]
MSNISGASTVGNSGAEGPWLTFGDGAAMQLSGAWTVANARRIDGLIRDMRVEPGAVQQLDLGAVSAFDTTGAWLLLKLADRLSITLPDGMTGAQHGVPELVSRVSSARSEPAEQPPGDNPFVAMLIRLGGGTVAAMREVGSMIGFMGAVVEAFVGVVRRPRRLRLTATVHHMEQAGLNALPIVGLISFLVGIVLAFQGAAQLQRFGAEIFVVNLIGVSMLREIGILLTAIVVAGRSGSSYAAQLGSMKVNEEVDALRALGLDTIEVLVLPRVLALFLMMVPLALFANLMGLIGGGLMAWVALDIAPALYVDRLAAAVTLPTLLVGLIKAPFFGALVGLVGCYEGLKTQGSADSLGRQTTIAVVQGIFIVIVVDAAFSIFFNVIGF